MVLKYILFNLHSFHNALRYKLDTVDLFTKTKPQDKMCTDCDNPNK